MKRSNHVKAITNRIIAVMLCLCIATAGPFLNFTYAVTQSDVDNTNAKLEELRKQQEALSDDFAKLNTQLDNANKKLTEIESRISDKLVEISSLEGEIDTLNTSIDKQYASMKLRIQYMYEQGSSSMLDLLFSAKNLGDFLAKSEYVIQMSIYDKSMMTVLENDLATQKEKQQTLAGELDTLLTLKAEAQKESDNVKSLLAGKQSQINASDEDIKKLEELALAYEKELEEQKAAQQTQPSVPDVSFDRGSGSVANYDETDVAIMAAIIECEGGNQPYEGLLAIGSVIVNRVKDPRFPNTVSGVIFSPGQFTPVASGRFSIVYTRGATDRCYQAAREVLNGHVNTNALYFHRYHPEKNETGTVIGDHIFMYSLH